MSLKVQALKNIAANWSGLGINIVVGFLLAPFILHRLGDVAFGLYALVFSFTGYYGLLDFGIRSSIIRYVARYHATEERHELNRLINTSLCSYCALALVLLAATALGSIKAASLFHVPGALAGTASLLFLMVGSGIAVGLPLIVFGAILEGLQQFTFLNLVQIVSTLLRAVLIIIVLTHGGGVLSVATITVGLNVLSCVPYAIFVLARVPIAFGFRFVDRATLKTIASYGSASFICSIAEKFRFGTDAIVIGIVLSAAAITFFSIASKLTDYSTGLVQYLAQVFTPLSSHLDATGELGQLQRLVVAGNRACTLVALPLCATLVVLGQPLIAVWVGPRYLSSYTVLVILIVARTLYVTQATSTKVAFGMNRHRPVAAVLLLEGALNLGLSVILARRWGIVGVAVGTAIPMLGTALLFLPLFTCHLVRMPLRRFLAEIYLLPSALCLPLVLALVAYRHAAPALTLMNLLGALVVAGLVYGTAFGWWFVTQDSLGLALRARVSKYF